MINSTAWRQATRGAACGIHVAAQQMRATAGASTVSALLRETLTLVNALEATTHRARATAIINTAVAYVIDAAAVLKRSRFSSTAIVKFRQRVSGAIMRASGSVSQLGWAAGGGKGKPPPDIKRQYLSEQQSYLSAWVLQIAGGQTMPGGAGRARQYAQSLEIVYQRAYNRAMSEGTGLPPPPAMPKDWSTQCKNGCKCHWRGPVKVDDNTYKRWWVMTPAEHCPDCLRRTREWNPITYRRIGGVWEMEFSG